MIRNYCKLAWRSIRRHPFYTVINIAGLFSGIFFTVLISVFVWQELSVNTQLRNAKQQYFLRSDWKGQDPSYALTTLGPLAKLLKDNYPALVADYYRWDGITSGVSRGDKSFREGIQLGDSTLLSMYGFELLHGNAGTALRQPYSAVVTGQIAVKYFGRTNVVGETITIQNFSGGKSDFLITGVLKDIPQNSVTELNGNNRNGIFIPSNTFSYFGRMSMDSWTNTAIPSYIELTKGAAVHSVDKAVNQLIQAHAPDPIKANLRVSLVPLTDYYREMNGGFVKRMLYTLSLAALFVLLMAVVNFINIAIGSSGNRIKEIGVRKVMGSMRSHLIFQFLAESFIVVLLATAAAFLAYPFGKSMFASITGKALPSLTSLPVYFAAMPLLIVLVVGFFAGAYPAFVLSSLKSVDALKGKLKNAGERIWLRKSLTGFQFSIALVVLIAAVVIGLQVNHFFNSNLGYDKEYVLTAQVPRDWSVAGVQRMKTIRNELAALPVVAGVSMSYEIPNGNNGGDPPVYRSGSDSFAAIGMQLLITDENYLNVYGIKMLAGEFFDSRGLDSGKVVMSKKAVQSLGFKSPDAAIGQQVRIPGDPVAFTIKGVADDFYFNSMQRGIQPLLFFNVYSGISHRYLSFRLKEGNIHAAVEALEKKWRSLMPGAPFQYEFMEDTLARMYQSELQMKNAACAATVLSVLIAMLGVLGLVSLTIHKRIREVGIRKVLGASVSQILVLFVKEFTMVMFFSSLIACPAAWWLMHQWLNNYSSHIGISVFMLIAVAGVLVAVTILLICLQSARIAITGPVKNLRTE